MENNILWTNFLDVLKTKISTVSFNTWFKETKLLKKESSKLTIQVPMTFHKKFLNDTYYDLIDEIIVGITGNNYDFEFIVEEELIEEKEVLIKEEDIDLTYSNINSNLNPKYTFENFVIGKVTDLLKQHLLQLLNNLVKYIILYLFMEKVDSVKLI